MKKILVSVMLLGLMQTLSASELALYTRPKYSTIYDKTANPHKDLRQAMAKAKKSGKYILLLVGGDWCRWCGTLDNLLEDDKKISKSFYDSFEVVRVYYGKGMNKEAQSLLKQLPKLKATPHFYILDKNAKLLRSIESSPLERGYGYRRSKVMDFINTNKNNTNKNKTNKKEIK